MADDRNNIMAGDVAAAIDMAVQKVQHSISRAYQEAVRSPQKKNLLAQVLLACALAPKDAFGFFTAGSVSVPMSVIMGKRYEIPAYARHLSQFCSDARGNVLTQRGEPRKYIYRFEDPLLQPYVILDGLARGLVSEDQVAELQQDSWQAPLWNSSELELPFSQSLDDGQA